MSNAQHYKSNLRDIYFNLFEVLHIDERILGKGEFSGMDADVARATLEAYDEFCAKELAPSWVASDRIPLTLDADGKWLKLNTEYAKVWPNITTKGTPPADADDYAKVKGKLATLFSTKPGTGS